MQQSSRSSTTTVASVRRMPAEWEPHEACILLYPHNSETFRLTEARAEFWNIVQTIANQGQERVVVFCRDDEQAGEVRKQQEQQLNSSDGQQIAIHTCHSDDTWARDTAPTFILLHEQSQDDGGGKCASSTSSTVTGIDWGFNAYGGPKEGCYWPCHNDLKVASTVCQVLKKSCLSLQDQLILEGGSIHTDGQGTLLTTKECLLNPNRNPHLTQHEIESILKETLGCKHIIWLDTGLAFDEDTNGHVDNFCCFVRPGHVVLAWTDDKEQDAENYERCRAAQQVLEAAVDAQGRALTIHKLHLPSPPLVYTEDDVASLTDDRQAGQRLAASYVNFYIANKAIVVPQFGASAVDSDRRAVETLSQLFPHRKVVGAPSREILLGGGNIHCITQQVPSSIGNRALQLRANIAPQTYRTQGSMPTRNMTVLEYGEGALERIGVQYYSSEPTKQTRGENQSHRPTCNS